MPVINQYVKPLEEQFKKHRDPARATQMKAYLKDQFEFYGVPAPIRKQLIQEHKNEFGLIPEAEIEEIIKWCWQQPEREWQYAAMDLLGRTARKVNKEILPLYEYLIVNKSWWDTIDFIASNLVGPIFKKYPEAINPETNKWMASNNMWLQRTCLLFQLKYKQNLDTALLESFIMPLKSSKEFFIRKAIGWILREYSKTNEEYVRDFVAAHELSGLSQREALKWLNRK